MVKADPAYGCRGPADFPCCRLHVRLSLLDVVGVQQDLRVAIEGGRDGGGVVGIGGGDRPREFVDDDVTFQVAGVRSCDGDVGA